MHMIGSFHYVLSPIQVNSPSHPKGVHSFHLVTTPYSQYPKPPRFYYFYSFSLWKRDSHTLGFPLPLPLCRLPNPTRMLPRQSDIFWPHNFLRMPPPPVFLFPICPLACRSKTKRFPPNTKFDRCQSSGPTNSCRLELFSRYEWLEVFFSELLLLSSLIFPPWLPYTFKSKRRASSSVFHWMFRFCHPHLSLLLVNSHVLLLEMRPPSPGVNWHQSCNLVFLFPYSLIPFLFSVILLPLPLYLSTRPAPLFWPIPNFWFSLTDWSGSSLL